MTEENVQVVKDNNLLIITLNRPAKKNAITLEMFNKITISLKESETDDDITIAIITGTGDYFTSGNDFSPIQVNGDLDLNVITRNRVDYVRSILYTMINYPKLLIGIVNGPAVGIGVTMLGLFDLVYCVENATFHTPFTNLGICAEGCSTYTFPRFLGKSLSAKMLYFNEKISAKEAQESGFVSIIEHGDIPKIMDKLRQCSSLPSKSLLYTKRMVRAHDIVSLNAALGWENEYLIELFQSDDFMTALMKRFSKSKL